jgi:Protein of unknown function (DUF3800)
MMAVSIHDLARLLLPRDSRDGILFMLVAYFDDSGTHAGSKILVIGGVWGTEQEWTPFDRAWAAKLQEPLPGKPSLRRFHMHDCEFGDGEFVGWKKPERDALIHDLREIILGYELYGYAFAVSRPDYETLNPALQVIFGDAESYAINNCIGAAQAWALEKTDDKLLSLVFDDRPNRERETERIYSIYHESGEWREDRSRLVGISFLRSEHARPLQAADIFAWETYRFCQDFLRDGEAAQPRPHLQRLLESGRFRGDMAGPETMREISSMFRIGTL